MRFPSTPWRCAPPASPATRRTRRAAPSSRTRPASRPGCCGMPAACCRGSAAAAQGLTLDALENVHRHYLAAGITSIIERGASLEGFETYRALKAANRLVVRSTVTIRVPQAGDAGAVQQFIDKLPFKPGEGDEWLKAGPLKLVADGGILIGTSYMRQPYGEGARAALRARRSEGPRVPVAHAGTARRGHRRHSHARLAAGRPRHRRRRRGRGPRRHRGGAEAGSPAAIAATR